MIAHKNVSKVVGVLMAAAVIACFGAMVFSGELVEAFGGNVVAMRYEDELFDTDRIIRIDIRMEEGEWEEMLADALAEEYYSCDVVINDLAIRNVGIRPKGNTSLSAVAMNPETDRFSLKLEFDHYVDGQNCFGLDKLVLNNNYADATNMKEAVVYDMYRYLGADASLYNYAEIWVNGEYWGVYLALEAVEDSFLLRNYGAEDGQLYKPEEQAQGGGRNREVDGRNQEVGGQNREVDGRNQEVDGRNQEIDGRFQDTDGQNRELQESAREPAGLFRGPGGSGDWPEEGPPGDFPPSGLPEMQGEGLRQTNNGADLNYTDDALDSYSAIWEGGVTDAGKGDYERVVSALENISGGTNLEEYLDVDNVLRYMAVHTFSVNLDSLSGNMAHNYYLYENGGRLNILPWDYNLSFGGMDMGGAGDASGMVNYAIDTPFQGTDFFNALLENQEYLSRYHEYLRQLTDGYVFGGEFEKTYNRIRSQIDILVEADPTAFYSYEEYEAGAGMLYLAVTLRAESIQGQLDGTIPSTDEGQRENASSLVDSSSVDIDAMGTFGMGGGGFAFSDKGNRGSGFSGSGDLVGDSGQGAGPKEAGVQGVGPWDAGSSPVRDGIPDMRNLAAYTTCLLTMALALAALNCYRRHPIKKTHRSRNIL